MGTNRNKRSHHGSKARRQHRNVAGAPLPSAATARPAAQLEAPNRRIRLWTLLPRAGMLYPSKGRLMRKTRQNVTVADALRKATPALAKGPIDTLFSRIFEEAVGLLRKAEMGTFDHNSILFLETLHSRPALQPWAEAMSPGYFIILFLALRGARLTWHESPREPFEPEKQCKVARSIDAFREVDTVDWNGPAMKKWLMLGGSKHRNDNLEDADKQGGTGEHGEDNATHGSDGEDMEDDGEDDDDLFVKQEHPVPQEVAQERELEAELLRLRREVDEAARHFHLDIDFAAIESAFREMRIKDKTASVRRRNGKPFLDDSDVDMDAGEE